MAAGASAPLDAGNDENDENEGAKGAENDTDTEADAVAGDGEATTRKTTDEHEASDDQR